MKAYLRSEARLSRKAGKKMWKEQNCDDDAWQAYRLYGRSDAFDKSLNTFLHAEVLCSVQEED